MDLNTFAQEVHQNAVTHGWWQDTRPLEEVLCLIHCELSEAIEEERAGRGMIWTGPDGKPEGIAIELLDAVIRCLDYMAHNEIEYTAKQRRIYELFAQTANLPGLVCSCHRTLSEIAIAPASQFSFLFSQFISKILPWLEVRGVSWEQEIKRKHEYNKTRPFKHGKVY